MESEMSFRPPARGRPTVIVAVWLAVSCGMGLNGCSEHRISLGEFRQIEQMMATIRYAQAEQQVGVNLDEYLGPYKAGPGDVLTVALAGSGVEPLLPALQVRVDRNGRITLPVAGDIEVGGMELEDVEDAIVHAFVPAIYKEAVCYVELFSADATNVLVVGTVALPGIVRLRRTERNLLFAIAAAGGVSDLASGYVTLRRIRRPTEEVTLNLRDPVQLKEAVTLDPLEQGDIVIVDAAQPNTIFVGGLVNRSGPQTYPVGARMTVLQALAAASGLRTDVTPKEGTLIRHLPDGTDVHVKLNLNRMAKGEDSNIALAAGDILWVPETFETKVQDFFNRNFFLRAGVSVNYSVTGIEFLNRRSMQGARFGGATLQDTFDPLGFLGQNTALQTITTQTAPLP